MIVIIGIAIAADRMCLPTRSGQLIANPVKMATAPAKPTPGRHARSHQDRRLVADIYSQHGMTFTPAS